MAKTHFKKNTDSPYLGAWDFPDYKDRNLTIAKVEGKMTEGLAENKVMNIASFTDKKVKPMLLNSTNAKAIKRLAKSPYIEDWTGLEITIYVEQNVKAFGELHDALRVRPIAPRKVKPTVAPGCDKWEVAKKAVANGSTLADIRKYYTITDVNFKKLKND